MDSAERWRGQSGEDPGMACQLGRDASDLVACESRAHEGIGIAPVCSRARGTAAGAAVAAGDQNNTIGGIRTRETLDDLAGLAINCESLAEQRAASGAEVAVSSGTENARGGRVGVLAAGMAACIGARSFGRSD
jgi:hypothetical protein